MRYIWQHINAILEHYSSGFPLSHFLKNYFRIHPKLGSRDRKILSGMAYCWYRCSKGFSDDLPVEERLKLCLFLCDTSIPRLEQFYPEGLPVKKPAADERWQQLQQHGISFSLEKLASSGVHLSAGITRSAWLSSMLQQPKLFLRIRDTRAIKILKEHEIAVEQRTGNCIALENGTAIDKILPPEYYVVQDASSQKTGNFLRPEKGKTWWDCCSGAGGKSLLLKDMAPEAALTVSDKRASILHNLSERFRTYHHQQPERMVLDVADDAALAAQLGGRRWDNIICDVPCSGSGTWARTPEQLYFFKEEYLREFSSLQTKITGNVLPYLRNGGYMIYITCSVFQEENEAVVDAILNSGTMTLENAELINGTDEKADSMFIAVLRKNE